MKATFADWWNKEGRLFMAGCDIRVQNSVLSVAEEAWKAAMKAKEVSNEQD